MKLGNVEPVLRYHAGMIEYTAGNRALAKQHLVLALEGRRALDPAQEKRAKQAIATLAHAEN